MAENLSSSLRDEVFATFEISREQEVAWAAGLFEGEGCISPSGRDKRYWVVSLVSTDETVVREFCRIVRCGKVVGPVQVKQFKPYWKWATGSKDGVMMVWETIGPLLHERRRARFEEAVASLATVRGYAVEPGSLRDQDSFDLGEAA